MPTFWSDLTKAADTGYAVSFFANKELNENKICPKNSKNQVKTVALLSRNHP